MYNRNLTNCSAPYQQDNSDANRYNFLNLPDMAPMCPILEPIPGNTLVCYNRNVNSPAPCVGGAPKEIIFPYPTTGHLEQTRSPFDYVTPDYENSGAASYPLVPMEPNDMVNHCRNRFNYTNAMTEQPQGGRGFDTLYRNNYMEDYDNTDANIHMNRQLLKGVEMGGCFPQECSNYTAIPTSITSNEVDEDGDASSLVRRQSPLNLRDELTTETVESSNFGRSLCIFISIFILVVAFMIYFCHYKRFFFKKSGRRYMVF